MVNSAVFLASRTRDLALQGGDPRIEFGHRQGVEILPRQNGQWIIRFAGENIVHVHGEES